MRDSISFAAPMVRATRAGIKTMTRRVVKQTSAGHVKETGGHRRWHPADPNARLACPYGQSGDRLRVKEAAWMWCERIPDGKTPTGRQKWRYEPLRAAPIHYAADHPEKPAINVVSPDTGNEWGWRLKVARFLPAWASRDWIEIVSVRVERLQDISEADAVAEGIEKEPGTAHWKQYDTSPGGWRYWESPIQSYRTLWESINGPGSWDANPFVWVIEFKRVENKP